MLLWISFERLDISYSAKRLTQCLVDPLMQDWIALKLLQCGMLSTTTQTLLKLKSMQTGLGACGRAAVPSEERPGFWDA